MNESLIKKERRSQLLYDSLGYLDGHLTRFFKCIDAQDKYEAESVLWTVRDAASICRTHLFYLREPK
jgi:hypothetical protein